MGEVFAHNWPQTKSCGNFGEVFIIVHRNSDEASFRFIIVDGTWIHHNKPETKHRSKQCFFRADRRWTGRPKWVCGTAGQVFWDAPGILHDNYFGKEKKSVVNIIPTYRLFQRRFRKNDCIKLGRKFSTSKRIQVHTGIVAVTKFNE